MRSRWSFLSAVVFFSVLTGIGGVFQNPDRAVFVKSAEALNVARKPVATPSADLNTIPSQIGDVKIIEQKYLAPSPLPTQQSNPYGTSRQIDDHTWTINVGQDKQSATANEILAALNNYREKKGKNPLYWNSSLANFAQSRASGFASKNALDAHAGFLDFVNNQDGFHKLGFSSLGENSSLGFVLDAVHLIEWVYAGDKPHDDNQLGNWTSVGIGVSGTATDLVFGTGKL